MKLLLGLFLVVGMQAASFSINPVTLIKAIHAKASPTTKARRISEIVLLGMNFADYRTTIIGTGRGFCETNQRFNIDGCRLNEPKFTRAKIAVSGFALMQEIPIWKRHQEGWNKVFLITNITFAIPLTKGVINNTRYLLRE